MFPKIALRWLPIATLALACLMALSSLLAAAFTGGLDQALIWILSTELLAPGLVGGLALTVYVMRKSHHTWRNTL